MNKETLYGIIGTCLCLLMCGCNTDSGKNPVNEETKQSKEEITCRINEGDSLFEDYSKSIYISYTIHKDYIFKYYGGIGKKVLKSYMELNNQINENEDNKIIVATGSYIGEGFDDSKLDVLFLTMPISGQTRVTQYAGRLHRQDSNKKEILIYDYIDDNFSKTRNMFLKRKKTYEKLGYEIVEEN